MITLEEAIVIAKKNHPNYSTVGKAFDVGDAWVFSMVPEGKKNYDPLVAITKDTGEDFWFFIPHQWERWKNRKVIGYVDE